MNSQIYLLFDFHNKKKEKDCFFAFLISVVLFKKKAKFECKTINKKLNSKEKKQIDCSFQFPKDIEQEKKPKSKNGKKKDDDKNQL